MSKYLKVLIIVGGLAAVIIYTTMNFTSGYKNQPLQTFLPCDTSQIIYAEDLGPQTWTASGGFIHPQYKSGTVSLQYVQNLLNPYVKQYTYSSKKLNEKSFQSNKTCSFYDRNGNCLFELFSKDDTVLVHTAGKTVKLSRKRK